MHLMFLTLEAAHTYVVPMDSFCVLWRVLYSSMMSDAGIEGGLE